VRQWDKQAASIFIHAPMHTALLKVNIRANEHVDVRNDLKFVCTDIYNNKKGSEMLFSL